MTNHFGALAAACIIVISLHTQIHSVSAHILNSDADTDTTHDYLALQAEVPLDTLLPVEVIVYGRKVRSPYETSSLNRSDLVTSAGSSNDLNRALSFLPGISIVATLENNDIQVKGGRADENLYLVDGIELSFVNHFATVDRSSGAFGFLNPEMFRK